MTQISVPRRRPLLATAAASLTFGILLALSNTLPAAAAETGQCLPVASVSTGTVKVAHGQAECLIPSGMPYNVTVILFLGGVEWDSTYTSCVAEGDQICVGTPVSHISPSAACSRVLVSWQLFDGWHHSSTQTGTSCP